jgi:hypothetical protein
MSRGVTENRRGRAGILATAGFFFFAIPALLPAISIGISRFGTCPPAGFCTVTINDNDGAFDRDPGIGVIDFDVTIGAFPDGTFRASGLATETAVGGGVLLTLTESPQTPGFTVQGLSGGIGMPPRIEGQIALISDAVIRSLMGVTGFVSLAGEYQGGIQFADVLAEGRVGGALIGRADPPAAAGIPGPVPFADFGSAQFPFPVNNVLIGTLNFTVSAGDGFLLPTSAEYFAAPIPEPSTLLLLGAGLIGMFAGRRGVGRKRSCLR